MTISIASHAAHSSNVCVTISNLVVSFLLTIFVVFALPSSSNEPRLVEVALPCLDSARPAGAASGVVVVYSSALSGPCQPFTPNTLHRIFLDVSVVSQRMDVPTTAGAFGVRTTAAAVAAAPPEDPFVSPKVRFFCWNSLTIL